MRVDKGTVIKSREVKLSQNQANILNSQSDNSGIEYVLIEEEKPVKKPEESTKRVRRTAEQIAAEEKK